MKNKRPYYIFLDDERFPKDVKWTKIPDLHWTVIRNYSNFKVLIELKGYLPEFISFDHDLADYSKYTEKTGYDCAKWLIQYCSENNLKIPDYTVHSLNPIGAKNIINLLESYKQYA
jgi:hypothetical protein